MPPFDPFWSRTERSRTAFRSLALTMSIALICWSVIWGLILLDFLFGAEMSANLTSNFNTVCLPEFGVSIVALGTCLVVREVQPKTQNYRKLEAGLALVAIVLLISTIVIL
jgi:uncharacterized membrane protein